MAAPTGYLPVFSFSGYQATTPAKPLPGPQVDNELANVSASVSSIIASLGIIQRSDGQLQNGIVTTDSLAASFSIGFTMRGAWTVGQSYNAGDGVARDGGLYKASITNVATTLNAPEIDTVTWLYLFSVADIAGVMSTLTYDPQGKLADAFARANQTGTQAISTIDGLAAALAAMLPLAGGVMSGDIDLAGHNLLNVGSRTGQIFQTTGFVAPTGSLKADGSVLLRATYPRLWAFVNNGAGAPMVAEASWSANTGMYSSGDGSTTFRVPDLRGVFLRGLDASRGLDGSRVQGSYQTDNFPAHGHTAASTSAVNDPMHAHDWGNTARLGGSPTGAGGAFITGGAPGTLFTTAVATGITVSTTTTVGSAGSGTETRPVNVAFPFCIYY